MKRAVPFFLALVLVAGSVVLPAAGAELAGGYYITGDSALGNGLTFYIQSDYANGSLTYDSAGNLFNLTSASVYLYCTQYPDYQIYAPRFDVFQYREGTSGYTYEDLNLHNVTASNVIIYDEDPPILPDSNRTLVMILVVMMILGAILVIFRR